MKHWTIILTPVCGLGLILALPVVPLATETFIGLVVWFMIGFGLALLEVWGREWGR